MRFLRGFRKGESNASKVINGHQGYLFLHSRPIEGIKLVAIWIGKCKGIPLFVILRSGENGLGYDVLFPNHTIHPLDGILDSNGPAACLSIVPGFFPLVISLGKIGKVVV